MIDVEKIAGELLGALGHRRPYPPARRVRSWPNGLGITVATSGGFWEVMIPAGTEEWQAGYFPRGAGYATKVGKGPSLRHAILAAVPVHPN